MLPYESAQPSHAFQNTTHASGNCPDLPAFRFDLALDKNLRFAHIPIRGSDRLVGWLAGSQIRASLRIWKIHGRPIRQSAYTRNVRQLIGLGRARILGSFPGFIGSFTGISNYRTSLGGGGKRKNPCRRKARKIKNRDSTDLHLSLFGKNCHLRFE